jgi:uncharacterized metal-binding protein
MATQVSPDTRSAHWPDRTATIAWGIALVVIAAMVWMRPHSHTVYRTYSLAGYSWHEGGNAYAENLAPFQGYYYSPFATLVFAALAMTPEPMDAVIWRLLGGLLLLVSFALACRALDPDWNDRSESQRRWTWLLLLPLAITNLHNGQANIHMAGTVLLAIAMAGKGRWMICAAFLAASCLFKVYHISTALLLLVVLPRQLGWRLPLALAVGLALPFLTQTPAYVISEYGEWLTTLAGNDRFVATGPECLDLSLLFRHLGAPMSRTTFAVVQLAAGAAAALVCLHARWRLQWSEPRLVRLAYFLGTSWILLCGPATESSTYVLLAPMAALLAGAAAFDRMPDRMPRVSRVCILAGGLLVLAAVTSSLFPFVRRIHPLGLHPLGMLLMLVGYLAWEFRASAETILVPARQ